MISPFCYYKVNGCMEWISIHIPRNRINLVSAYEIIRVFKGGSRNFVE